MSALIKSPKDFWTGVMFLCFGGIAFAISRDYAFGSAGRMGPGYFPSVLSCLLMSFGALTLLRGVRQHGAALGAFAWKQAAIGDFHGPALRRLEAGGAPGAGESAGRCAS